MNKILLIIQREYLTRVRKRSFIVMTILGPILMAALFIIPVYVSQVSDEKKTVAVIDETGLFIKKLPGTDNLSFDYLKTSLANEKARFRQSGYYAILYIPRTELSVPSKAVLYSDKQPNIMVKSHIEEAMKKEIEALKLEASGIDKNILQSIRTSVNVSTIKINDSGKEEKSFTEVSMVLGMVTGLLIYFFIFIFGSQVMRGVIEEKTSRVVEVIMSSVKPFQLMMGKVVGVALVGLTQFMLWVVLTFILITAFQSQFHMKSGSFQPEKAIVASHQMDLGSGSRPDTLKLTAKDQQVNEVLEVINSIDFGVVILTFIFFFLGGYLLYAALFAAIGAAVDSEADTQQFVLPVTIPLILAIVVAQFIIMNPESPLAFWLSVIPFTSPVIMMIRIPFGVPYYQLALSMVLLILGFLGTIWMASRIYRTGILMYGKKVNYKELWKWVTYRG